MTWINLIQGMGVLVSLYCTWDYIRLIRLEKDWNGFVDALDEASEAAMKIGEVGVMIAREADILQQQEREKK